MRVGKTFWRGPLAVLFSVGFVFLSSIGRADHSALAPTRLEIQASVHGFAGVNFVLETNEGTLLDAAAVTYRSDGVRHMILRLCPVSDMYPHPPSLACDDYHQELKDSEFTIDEEASLAVIDTYVEDLGRVNLEISSVMWVLAEVNCQNTQLRNGWSLVEPFGVRWAVVYDGQVAGMQLYDTTCGTLGKSPFMTLAFL